MSACKSDITLLQMRYNHHVHVNTFQICLWFRWPTLHAGNSHVSTVLPRLPAIVNTFLTIDAHVSMTTCAWKLIRSDLCICRLLVWCPCRVYIVSFSLPPASLLCTWTRISYQHAVNLLLHVRKLKDNTLRIPTLVLYIKLPRDSVSEP